jgi:dolichol-phosphate mannosyltransferase
MLDNLTVVAPMRNEEDTAFPFLDRLTKAIAENSRHWRIIIPLTATDNTRRILESFKVDVILVPPGLGLAYRQGLSRALDYSSDRVLTLDTDLSHIPEEMNRLLEVDADIVLGARDTSEAPLHRRFTSYMVNSILRGPFSDYTSSYRLYRRKVLETILPQVRSNGFAFLPEIVFRSLKLGYTIEEVSVSFPARIAGESKMSYKANIRDYARFLRWRYIG